MEIIYTKLNTHRKPEYQISTTIFRDGETLYVKKKALNKKVNSHIQKMIENTDPLCKVIDSDDESVTFEYISGKTVSDLLLEACDNYDKERFINIINEYKDFILKKQIVKREIFNPTSEFVEIFGYTENMLKDIDCFVKSNIDLNFDNIILDEDSNYIVLDSEWVFDFEVPVNFVLFRTGINFFIKNGFIIEKLFSLDDIFYLLGLSSEDIQQFNIMDSNFSKYVHGENYDNSKYEKDVSSIDPKKQEIVREDKCRMQVFFPQGGGYSEFNSLELYFEYSEQFKQIEFTVPIGFKGYLRIDPCDTSSLTVIKNIIIYKQEENKPRTLLKLFSYDTNFNDIALNTEMLSYRNNGFLYLFSEKDDPNFILDYHIDCLNSELITVNIELSVQKIKNKNISDFISGYFKNRNQVLEEEKMAYQELRSDYSNIQDKYNNLEHKCSNLENEIISLVNAVSDKSVLNEKIQDLETITNSNIKIVEEIDRLDGSIKSVNILNDKINILDESIKSTHVLNERINILDESIKGTHVLNDKINILDESIKSAYVLNESLAIYEKFIELQNENDGLKNTLNLMLSSNSWKMTSPIRDFLGMFKNKK